MTEIAYLNNPKTRHELHIILNRIERTALSNGLAFGVKTLVLVEAYFLRPCCTFQS